MEGIILKLLVPLAATAIVVAPAPASAQDYRQQFGACKVEAYKQIKGQDDDDLRFDYVTNCMRAAGFERSELCNRVGAQVPSCYDPTAVKAWRK